MDMGILV
jgi:hypothetical protein